MTEILVSKKGMQYLPAVLRQKDKITTRANLWKILHNSGKEELSLKLGRYTKSWIGKDVPETSTPKSELTLDPEEFEALLKYLEENLEPFKLGVMKYIPLDETFDPEKIEHVRAIFDNPDRASLLKFVAENNIIAADLVLALQSQARRRAIAEFEKMLVENPPEATWQAWFKENNWVLGTEFVRILDEREVDTKHITDYLVQAYDGFLDIVEIKKPDPSLKFWADGKDHGNWVPYNELVKAIAQATRYIYEVEREANSVKFLEKVGNVRTVKPRCVLIYGRSTGWTDEHREAFRILNSSYHNLSIMTYDHVLDRAKRIVGQLTPSTV